MAKKNAAPVLEIVLNWEDMDRESKIRTEKARLTEILRDVPEKQIALCERLIDRAAFMLVTLMDYEQVITTEGIITELQQGEYTIQRENPAAKGYNTMIKNYCTVIKQLTDQLPGKKEGPPPGDKLVDFLAKGKK